MYVLWGKTLIFFVSLGIAEISGFSEISVYTEVVLFKTFPQHFKLTFLEFHFETEAKGDFPSACI